MTTPGVPNIWVVRCRNCGTYDMVGPGHPATRFNAETGQHEIFDRNAFRHQHAEDCVPDPDSGYSLDFSFMAAPAGMSGS